MQLPVGVRRCLRIAALLTLVAVKVGADCPDLITRREGLERYTGHFYDSYWGFSLDIPESLAGYSDPPPSPMHGIEIPMHAAPAAVAYFLAYDKPLTARMREIEKDQLLVLRAGEVIEKISRRKTVRMGGLPAVRYEVTYRCGGDDPLHETFFLIENPGRRVFYRVGFFGHQSRFKADERQFRKIAATFRAHLPQQ